MKFASDFREMARDALRGKWGLAVITGLIASLLGAGGSTGPEIKLEVNSNSANLKLMFGNQQIYSSAEGMFPELSGFLISTAVYVAIVALVMAALFFVLSSVISLGYSRFNLELVDRKREPQVGMLFGYFPHWKNAAIANLLQFVYVLLWSLLLIIPGIMAAYSYSMTRYIQAEQPELTPSKAIARSKEMMDGNRWRLFCLQMSFIGWNILSMLTLGIGNLWLLPYQQAATAAFYRDLKKEDRKLEIWEG